MIANQILERIQTEIIDAGRDARYKPQAYVFILNGLEFFITKLSEKRHVTGQELSAGLAEYAARQYGPLARTVLNDWGIYHTSDFGYIVYNLIDISLLSKRPEDSVNDFADVFDLQEYFDKQEHFPVDKEYVRKLRGA
ncbi:MAG: hypothetical protein GF401_11265 [Chitinivibrionales bacterium]|nr:hypothetical protein [Chitinivibrionales bacterium]